MGVIKDIVEEVDKSEEEKKELGETLDLLVSLADAKAEHCQKVIEDDLKSGRVADNDTLYFPITHIADKRVQYRCITSDTPGDLIPTITQSITGMFDSATPTSIISGIAATASEFLQVIIGAGEGEENYAQVYTTGIDGSGMAMSLVRTDLMFWCRQITASSLKQKMDSALSCVAYKSVIDVTKIGFDDFRNIYTKVVDKGIPDDVSDEERKNIIERCIKEAREIYDLLGGGTNVNADKTSNVDIRNLKLGRVFS